VRSNRSDGYSGSPKPSQVRAGGMLPIDERPKRRYKKKRAKGGLLAMAEPTDVQEQEQLGGADEEAANEINEQLASEQTESRPKKRAGTTGQPGARKNVLRMNVNRTKAEK
jgi:hypothetical protein